MTTKKDPVWVDTATVITLHGFDPRPYVESHEAGNLHIRNGVDPKHGRVWYYEDVVSVAQKLANTRREPYPKLPGETIKQHIERVAAEMVKPKS